MQVAASRLVRSVLCVRSAETRHASQFPVVAIKVAQKIHIHALICLLTVHRQAIKEQNVQLQRYYHCFGVGCEKSRSLTVVKFCLNAKT